MSITNGAGVLVRVMATADRLHHHYRVPQFLHLLFRTPLARSLPHRKHFWG